MELGVVYVITTNAYIKENIWKIGCTKNLHNRLKTINATRFENDHFFIKMFWQTRHYFNLEQGLHVELKEYRKNNEFFQCPYNLIENALENYLSQKPRDYIYDDAVLIPALSRNLKWFENEKIFTIEENNIEITMNEDTLRQEIKSWIYIFGNQKILKFAHSSFWDKYLWLLKKNFATSIATSIATFNQNKDDFDDISSEMANLFLT